MEQLNFLSEDEVRALQRDFGTPLYVYDQASLEARAAAVAGVPNAYGVTARYAMKALPTAAVIGVLTDAGLHIDASSGYEAERALRAGVEAGRIQITAQELPKNLGELVRLVVGFNACSLHQLQAYGSQFPGTEVSIRVNPGLGSGHSNRTNVGGPSASFGIWHEHLDGVLAAAAEHRLRIAAMHTHIGSGSDPDVWMRCAELSLSIVAHLTEVRTLSLGGGFKVGRMPGEASTDIAGVGERIRAAFEGFAAETGRALHLEIEPGTYLVANAGTLICTAADVVDTGAGGRRFIKLDGGMTEILRPSLYGAQHPIVSVPAGGPARETRGYIVVGHCCESGDTLTPEPGNPEGLLERELFETRIGDAVVIEGAGAYCAGMSAKNYNSFPECAEVLRVGPGNYKLIRRRQTLDQILVNEVLD